MAWSRGVWGAATKGFTDISWQWSRSSLRLCGGACSLVSTCTCLFSPNLCFLGTAIALSISLSLFPFSNVVLITLLFPLFALNSWSHEQTIQPCKFSFQLSDWTSCFNKSHFLPCWSPTQCISTAPLLHHSFPFAHLPYSPSHLYTFLFVSYLFVILARICFSTSFLYVPRLLSIHHLHLSLTLFLSLHLFSQFLPVSHPS